MAAIVMTNNYELSTYDKSTLYLDKKWLMANAVNARKEVYAVAESLKLASDMAVAGVGAADATAEVATGASVVAAEGGEDKE